MKKLLLLLVLIAGIVACNNKKKGPDVSDIKVDIPVVRFDRAFFNMDSTDIPAGLKMLRQQYPDFYTDFMQQILGVDGSDTSRRTLYVTHEFLKGYRSIYDSLQEVYKKPDWLKSDLEHAFQYVKYYFPKYIPGKAYVYVGPFDAPGVALTRTGLAIGLQQFAGSNFSVYQSAQGQELFPLYISRRFAPGYITANCMKAVVEDIFPNNYSGKPLIEQMVEKGKQWYLLDKFMPFAPDSVKTGYTQHQLDWCKEFEGNIWSHIVKNEDLQSLVPSTIQQYIGEGPFTQGLSQEDSPGNIGQWIGWQIVKKYAEKNSSLTPGDIMKTNARKILEEAKYKPK
ncbi:MAG: hypothetical protein NTW29_16380 [Bacteroidetes bacterium]|nr:hypothetical protein [Bacteroidota bacterium]